jgi:PhnB protein
MSDVSLEVYLYFKGECRQAMEFYKSIFGGELSLNTYAETGADKNGDKKDWLMHASLEGGVIKLMASDTERASPTAAKVELSLGGSDEAQLRAIFDKLAEGGKVKSELKKEFWGDIFGSLTDKYGIAWMMNIAAKS